MRSRRAIEKRIETCSLRHTTVLEPWSTEEDGTNIVIADCVLSTGYYSDVVEKAQKITSNDESRDKLGVAPRRRRSGPIRDECVNVVTDLAMVRTVQLADHVVVRVAPLAAVACRRFAPDNIVDAHAATAAFICGRGSPGRGAGRLARRRRVWRGGRPGRRRVSVGRLVWRLRVAVRVVAVGGARRVTSRRFGVVRLGWVLVARRRRAVRVLRIRVGVARRGTTV